METALDALKCSGVDSRRRAETLTVSEFVNLSNCLNEVLNLAGKDDELVKSF